MNGDTASAAMSSGDKMTSLSLAGSGADELDFGEAFQPHVDTKQIQILPETSPGKTNISRYLEKIFLEVFCKEILRCKGNVNCGFSRPVDT